MKKDNQYLANQSRREFLKKISVTGSAVYLGLGGIFSLAKFNHAQASPDIDLEYQFRTVSVDHVQEVGRWINKLKEKEKIGKNKTYRGYLDGFNFNPEEILPGARSIVIISVSEKLASLVFNYKGEKIKIFIPPGYYAHGLKSEDIEARVKKDVLKDPDKKLQTQIHLPLKTIAVRSGLADYGKNNITFVDGYGSFHFLRGFYTDMELEDNWRRLMMLRLCKGCSICKDDCPTECIREKNFVIDIDKCVTLYNELEDPIPETFPPKSHNAMVGCLKCQYTCPANEHRLNDVVQLAEMTEEETEFLLSSKTDGKTYKQLQEKMVRFPSIKYLDYFRRNFKLAFENRDKAWTGRK